jgi:hypothetical protein
MQKYWNKVKNPHGSGDAYAGPVNILNRVYF